MLANTLSKLYDDEIINWSEGATMAKRILVLQGSGRKNKNTHTLAQSFIKGAEASGNEVTYLQLAGLNINECLDCKHCFTHEGKCVQDDDMQDIYALLHSHDMLVLATPIYFFGMTALTRAPLDRMYAGIGKPFSINSMALLVTFQDSDETIVQPIIDQFDNMVQYCKYENKGTVYAHDLNSEEDIQSHPALKDAYDLGFSLANE